ncbi:unnamed protein product [Lymnaea stagnalis]|uniref:Lipase domain-containing protein n=1 Tax=Lymnaea stagnalis TaxID=6523 RepID=A0AAV2IHV6_LYMST
MYMSIALHLIIGVHGAMAATRCYDNLGCYDSGTLHALPQDPGHIRTQFQVSCTNSTNYATVNATDNPDTMKRLLEASCFQVYRFTKFVIHGFNDDPGSDWLHRVRDGLLAKGDYNVFILDWHHGDRFPYEQAVANSYLVARQLAMFLRHLELVHGLAPPLMHLIGHSLGAQIAGNTGKALAPTRVARITGLDPAEPHFDTVDDSARLDSTDALFVDVIHTDGATFTGTQGYGSLRPQGHADFYPNGGQKQPGCVSSDLSGFLPGLAWDKDIACSHARSYDLFIQSLSPSSCQLEAYRCTSWEEYDAGNCTSCPANGCLPMGIGAAPPSDATGQYFLSTGSRAPFCGQTYSVQVVLSRSEAHAYGRLFLALVDARGSSGSVDFSRSNNHYHSGQLERHLVTVTESLGELSQVMLLFNKGTGLSSLGTSDYLSVEKITVSALNNATRSTFCSTSPGLVKSGSSLNTFSLQTCSLV